MAGLYDAVLPSVVLIRTQTSVTTRGTLGSSQRPVQGEGSGFVWSSEGYVVTNHHVVENASRVTVVFADGSELEADVLGSDPDSDLAVLKIDSSAERLQALAIGDSSALRVGQLAVAIGSPFGQDFTMTRGIISALGRAISSGNGAFLNTQLIQTDAPINPGNSGGPLLDRHGSVIGINSQIISGSGTNAGVGFAIPISTAKRVVPELIASGKYDYAYLGIGGVSLSPWSATANGLARDTRGAPVVDVVNEGPAEEAAFGGAPIRRRSKA